MSTGPWSTRLPRTGVSLLGRCTAAQSIPRQQVRWIGVKYLKKKQDAEAAWQQRAKEIEDGTRANLWDVLNERGYVKDVAAREGQIADVMRRKRIGAYVGIDPTARSLHVGHLLPLMPLFWMYLHGYVAITLVGGATARIGDPTGRLRSREIMANAEHSVCITKIHYQLKKLWDNVEALGRRYGYEKEWAWQRHLLNNNAWWNKLPMYDVLKRLGRFMRIGPMLSRDTVKRKLEEGDGMSFAEFTYPLMQGWDWWHMYKTFGVQMQIGGSDQFGNIVTGMETVRAVRASEENPDMRLPAGPVHDPVGFTVPLLTDSAGVKFGKSAGNAVWLDPFETSAFDLYGYFMRRPDDDMERLLKMFTFMPVADVQKIMKEHEVDPRKRVAQHKLAFEVLCLVHGEDVARREEAQHKMMFGGGSISDVDNAALHLPRNRPADESALGAAMYEAVEGHATVLNNAPKAEMQLPASLVMAGSLPKIIRAAGLASSASDAHRLVAANGAYVAAAPGNQGRPLQPGSLDWTPVKQWVPGEVAKYLLGGKVLILRKGKHNVRIIEVVDDETWAASGQTYLGEPGSGKVRQMMAEIKRRAEEEGTELSGGKFRAEVGEAIRASEERERVAVVNNPAIEFPTQFEVRERFKAERMSRGRDMRAKAMAELAGLDGEAGAEGMSSSDGRSERHEARRKDDEQKADREAARKELRDKLTQSEEGSETK